MFLFSGRKREDKWTWTQQHHGALASSAAHGAFHDPNSLGYLSIWGVAGGFGAWSLQGSRWRLRSCSLCAVCGPGQKSEPSQKENWDSLLLNVLQQESIHLVPPSSVTGERFRKHRVRPEPRGGAQLPDAGGVLTPASFRPRKDWKFIQQNTAAGAIPDCEGPAAVRGGTDGAGAPVLHLRWDIRVEDHRFLPPQAGGSERPSTSDVLTR